jgi:steroid 5-alpha reductase family enzyme
MTATASAMASMPLEQHRWHNTAPTLAAALLPSTTSTLGFLHTCILPSFSIHSGLGLLAYGLARATDRVDLKDYLWPTGMVLNAWWTAIGRHALDAPVSHAFNHLGAAQTALLGAVTAWGARLLSRIVTRSVRRGADDPRYQGVKTTPGFWNKASLLFALEAAFQTLISLPFTLPFRADAVLPRGGYIGASASWAPAVRCAAAGLFTAGLALETLADWQLEAHAREDDEGRAGELLRAGVWSLVRHPNYLGDALCHAAFPLWCYGSRLFTLPLLLGPAANYFFLRRIGGDREVEASQAERYARENRGKLAQLELYQLQKHAFWPSVFEVVNPWLWVVIGIGAVGAAAEFLYESRVPAAFPVKL